MDVKIIDEEHQGWIREISDACDVPPEQVVSRAIDFFVIKVKNQLQTSSKWYYEHRDTWTWRKMVAQAALDEEAARIFTEPITDEELDALDLDTEREAKLRSQFGKFYMPTYQVWLDRLIEERGSNCQRCRQPKKKAELSAHHRHYQTRGEETSRDFALVCKRCHQQYHYRRKNDEKLTPAGSGPRAWMCPR